MPVVHLVRRPSPFDPSPASASMASPTCCCCCCCCLVAASSHLTLAGRLGRNAARRHGRPAVGPVVLALLGLVAPPFVAVAVASVADGYSLVVGGLVGLAIFASAGLAAGDSPVRFGAVGLGLMVGAVLVSICEVLLLFYLIDLLGDAAVVLYFGAVPGAVALAWVLTPPPDPPSDRGWPPVPPDAPPPGGWGADGPPVGWSSMGHDHPRGSPPGPPTGPPQGPPSAPER